MLEDDAAFVLPQGTQRPEEAEKPKSYREAMEEFSKKHKDFPRREGNISAVLQDRSVYFTPCALLVQRLFRVKSELTLEKELKRLDKFEALLIDDLGYVQQSREQMEVLFTLLAHRYEHRSVLLTSNLIFSDWEKIFRDPMTTAAAVDRLVHHSVLLELNLSGYRMHSAQARRKKGESKK